MPMILGSFFQQIYNMADSIIIGQFVGFPFLFMYNILSTMFTSIGESKIPLGLLIFSSILNIFMNLWMVAGLGLGVFGAALATLIAQGISAVFSLLLFLSRMRQYKSNFDWFDRLELHSMLQIAVPSVLQQSTVSIGIDDRTGGCKSFWCTGACRICGDNAGRECFFPDFCVHCKCSFFICFSEPWRKKIESIKKDITLHTQISSLFLGKDGTALAYQVSGDYMRWLGYFFIFMGIKMATDGVLRGFGIMRPFLIANMVNLGIRLSVALIFAPRFGIAFVWLAVPAGWFANFLISYVALRRSWPKGDI